MSAILTIALLFGVVVGVIHAIQVFRCRAKDSVGFYIAGFFLAIAWLVSLVM